MSADVAKASKKSRLSVSSWLARIAIYSTVVAGIMASFYDFKLNTIVLPSSPSRGKKFYEPILYISSVNRAQQAYYAEYGQFSDNITQLARRIKIETLFFMGDLPYFKTEKYGSKCITKWLVFLTPVDSSKIEIASIQFVAEDCYLQRAWGWHNSVFLRFQTQYAPPAPVPVNR